MNPIIIKPRNEFLKGYVQYFLFFNKTDTSLLNYTTFPNNNLCLAIYKENNIDYINNERSNNCLITGGNGDFVSRLYGFHKRPFHVNINTFLDQVCIIFYPAALGAFTGESYKDLMKSDRVFEAIFQDKNSFFLEQLFSEADFEKRAQKIESLLLKSLKYRSPDKLKDALLIISKSNSENMTVELLAWQLGLSETSVFRLFKAHLGQNPKSFLKTIRFRKALDKMLSKKCSLTEIAYLNQYYDQAHLINDFRSLTGYSPKKLTEKISIPQDGLAWICDREYSA